MIENFGSNLARLRKERNLTQTEFSEMLGITKQTISNIEQSKAYPSFTTLEKISQLLKAGPTELFGTENEILLYNTPKLLDEVDSYQDKIHNILKLEQALEKINKIDLDNLVDQVSYIQNFFSKTPRTDETGEPILDNDNQVSFADSPYSKVPVQEIEKLAMQIKEIKRFKD
ncbi:helix-turn-helix domain-containing protein [Vagococcus sp. PNs007]|uniref:Helix-turn-helix domain-containing protein n=1 Tax=Vagococcus proximus TaxID=2991417 RepID=A0ABT5X0X9_9ENTE|nr:helix-turn-helix transcriptional regulator [Vagococcus proximus]MDF0479658.1 helix-turn-helix domain-containing protein [Vagococcus proximus]